MSAYNAILSKKEEYKKILVFKQNIVYGGWGEGRGGVIYIFEDSDLFIIIALVII